MKVKHSYFNKMHRKLSAYSSTLLLLLLAMAYSSCQKPKLEETKPKEELKTMNGSEDLTIDISDIVAKLPKTMLHKFGASARIYPDKTEWNYSDYGLMV